jgi:hypothetical protein
MLDNFNDVTQLPNESLIAITQDPDNDWQGTDNGDTTGRYQARQSFVLAASLCLIGREIQSETPILTKEQKEALNDKCRHMLMRPESILGESGNSRFCAEKLLYLWKTKFTNGLTP